MKRTFNVAVILLCSFYALKADVSLSGIITNKADIGIDGATVTLSKLKHLSTITDTDGKFIISETPIRQYQQNKESLQFQFKENSILFPSVISDQSVEITIYSISGRKILNKVLNPEHTVNQSFALPELNSGIYIISIKIDKKSYRYTVTSLNKDLFFKSHSYDNKERQVSNLLSKITTAVDTLTVSRSGFLTKKIPVESYTQKDLVIALDSSASGQKRGLTAYFIRHAETVANASGEMGGGGPVENHDTLTALGEQQVEELKDFLTKENIKPDLVIVSPSLRTQKTIEPFLIASKSKAEIWVEINECCGEDPSGIPIPTEKPEPRWKMKIEPMSDNFIFRDNDDKYYWWPQSYEEGLFMIMTAKERILERFSQSGKTIVIVGHAVNGGIFLGLMQGYDMLNEKPDRPVYLLNTGIVKLTQDSLSGQFSLKQNIYSPPRK